MAKTTEVSERKDGKRPLVVRIIGLTILMVVIAFLWWQYGPVAQLWWQSGGPSELWEQYGPDSRRDKSSDTILVTGTIEATEVDVSAEIAGRIVELSVEEGDRVIRGQLIAKIEASQIEAEVLHAEAVLQASRAGLGDIEAGARSEELERARSHMELAAASLELAEAEWRRAEMLFKGGVFSENELDTARASRDVARRQHETAAEELKLLEAGSRPDQIEASRWQVKQAEAALKLAQVKLEKAEITAPIGGVVLIKGSERGEVISPGVPIVTIANLDDMWVKIYINEVDIGRILLGQRAKVRVDSFPDREFAGNVSNISAEAEFTPKNIQTREDRVKLVFAVKIGIDNAGGLLKPGMYADIELQELQFEPSLPDTHSD